MESSRTEMSEEEIISRAIARANAMRPFVKDATDRTVPGIPPTFVMLYTIVRLENRRRVVRGHIGGQLDWEDIGWWMILSPGNISYYIGAEKPENMREGQTLEVKMTVVGPF